MSNYRNSPTRLLRKVGPLPSLTRKRAKLRTMTPGQHGKIITKRKFIKKKSAYGLRLWEKQKLRFNYNIHERQLLRYVRQAKKSSAPTGDTLLGLLEMRLDNTVFRLGMARSIVAARQLVVHGHVTVNGQKLTLPSYSCAKLDKIGVLERDRSVRLVRNTVAQSPGLPKHLSFDPNTLTGVVDRWVNRAEIRLKINPLLVVEYYSKD